MYKHKRKCNIKSGYAIVEDYKKNYNYRKRMVVLTIFGSPNSRDSSK